MALSQIMWPTDLPQDPLIDGYQRTMGRDVITSEFDVGPKRQRKRSSSAMTQIQCSYFLRRSQRRSFEEFAKLVEGRSFWWPDPEDSFRYKYCRFAEAPVVKPRDGIHYQIDLRLEMWPYIEKGTDGTSGTSDTTGTSGSGTTGS